MFGVHVAEPYLYFELVPHLLFMENEVMDTSTYKLCFSQVFRSWTVMDTEVDKKEKDEKEKPLDSYTPEEWKKKRMESKHYLPESPHLDPVPETGKRRRYCKACRKTKTGNLHDLCREVTKKHGTEKLIRINVCDGCGIDPFGAPTAFIPCGHQYCHECIERKYRALSNEEKYRLQKECRICGLRVKYKFCW